MARRSGEPTDGRRYVGNVNTMEVHDLDNEQTGANECQIDEIIATILQPTVDGMRRRCSALDLLRPRACNRGQVA